MPTPTPPSLHSHRSAATIQTLGLPAPVTTPAEPVTISSHFHLRHQHVFIKNEAFAAFAEFCGTFMFLFFAFAGANIANVPSPVTTASADTTGGAGISANGAVNTQQLLYISLCFGFSLAVNVFIFFRVSGGLFNPAVSFGLMLVGVITPLRAAVLAVSQIVGGIAAAGVVDAIFPEQLNVRTTLVAGINTAQGLFLEMFCTCLLMLSILFLAAEKHKATFLAPICIGLALFVAELGSVYYTGGSLNPARTFGPDVVLGAFAGYHWIYWLGPCMGSTLACGFYKLSKYLEYETVNPDQDTDGERAAPLLAIAVPEVGSPRIMDAQEVQALVAHQDPGAVNSAEKGLRAIVSH